MASLIALFQGPLKKSQSRIIEKIRIRTRLALAALLVVCKQATSCSPLDLLDGDNYGGGLGCVLP
jgi:hypothetical protein